jgi:hypothetical protein
MSNPNHMYYCRVCGQTHDTLAACPTTERAHGLTFLEWREKCGLKEVPLTDMGLQFALRSWREGERPVTRPRTTLELAAALGEKNVAPGALKEAVAKLRELAACEVKLAESAERCKRAGYALTPLLHSSLAVEAQSALQEADYRMRLVIGKAER